MIRVIVTEPGCEPVTNYVYCVMKELRRELIPSDNMIIDTLKKTYGYSDRTDYYIKGISNMLESELDKWPKAV